MQQSAQLPDGWMHREYKTQLGPAARSLQGSRGIQTASHPFSAEAAL